MKGHVECKWVVKTMQLRGAGLVGASLHDQDVELLTGLSVVRHPLGKRAVTSDSDTGGYLAATPAVES